MQSFAQLTPATGFICPELSEVFPEKDSDSIAKRIPGAIDFFLNGELRWGIEILVGGKGIGEHMDRFSATGKYSELQVKDYVVVDFRVGKVSQQITRDPKRITVVFSEDDFSECSCILGKAEPVVLKLAH